MYGIYMCTNENGSRESANANTNRSLRERASATPVSRELRSLCVSV